MKKKVLGCWLSIFLVGSMLTGCSTATEEDENLILIEKEQEAIVYEMAIVSVDDVIKTQKLRCSYQQVNDESLSFSVSGKRVAEVYVEEGDPVVKGQLLAELDIGNADEQIRSLEYNIARNEIILNNLTTNENNDISAAWLRFMYQSGQSEAEKKAVEENVARIQNSYRHSREDCEDALSLDRAQLAILQQDVKNSRIYAGMDGTVYEITERLAGSTSVMGEEVIKIIDSSECLFEVKDMTWASAFEEGMEIDLNIVSGVGAGSYKITPYDVENWDEIMLFTLADADANSSIGVGASGTMQFALDERKQVLCVPLKAVHQAGEQYYVYVLGEENMREVKWIEIGLVGDDKVEIVSGLAEGEKVILK